MGLRHTFLSNCEDTSSVDSIVLMQFISSFPLSRCHRRHSQALNCHEDVSEQFSRNRNLRHLEDYLPGVAHNLCPDLDQFLPQRGQRPVPHRAWQHRLSKKVPHVVGQDEQQQPHLIVHKVMARQPRAVRRHWYPSIQPNG